jgi:hypothetical protein
MVLANQAQATLSGVSTPSGDVPATWSLIGDLGTTNTSGNTGVILHAYDQVTAAAGKPGFTATLSSSHFWAGLIIPLNPAAVGGGPKTYFVSAAGSDANPGTSTGAPFATVTKINTVTLNPGDSVMFRNGDTFTDAGLFLLGTGSQAARVVVGTYGGTGLGATIKHTAGHKVASGFSYIDLQNLTFDGNAGTVDVFTTSFSGSGSVFCTMTNCTATNSTGRGFAFMNTADDTWTLTDCDVSNVGGTGVSVSGPNFKMIATGAGTSVVANVGTNSSSTSSRDGISISAMFGWVQGVEVNGYFNFGMSIRRHGGVLLNNYVHTVSGNAALAFVATVDTIGDTTYFVGNRVDVPTQGISITGTTGIESYVFASNTIKLNDATNGTGIDARVPTASMKIGNNVISGSFKYVWNLNRPSGTYQENHNAFFRTGFAPGTGLVFGFNGQAYSYTDYASTSTQGGSMVMDDPKLGSSPDYTPGSGSPLREAGTTTVDAAVVYFSGTPGAVQPPAPPSQNYVVPTGTNPLYGVAHDITAVGMTAQQASDAQRELARDASGQPRQTSFASRTVGALELTPGLSTVSPWTIAQWSVGSTFTRVRYVSPTATGSDDGSQPTHQSAGVGPWTLLQARANNAPGDDVVFADGTYNAPATPIFWSVSGTLSNPIRWRSANFRGARIVAQAADDVFQISTSGDYIVIDGFEVDGNNYLGGAVFHLKNTRTHVAVMNCKIHHSFGGGITTEQGDYYRFDGNDITLVGLNGNSTSHPSGISINQRSNNYTSDGFTGFHHYVVNNVISGTKDSATPSSSRTDGNGIILDNGGTPSIFTMAPTLVANNIVFQCGNRGIHALHVNSTGTAGAGIFIGHNTCWENGLDTLTNAEVTANATNGPGEFNNQGSTITLFNNVAKTWRGTGTLGTIAYNDAQIGTSVTTCFACYHVTFAGSKPNNITSTEIKAITAPNFKSPPISSTTATDGESAALDPATVRANDSFRPQASVITLADGGDLQAALSNSTPYVIVLGPGTYGRASAAPFAPQAGHTIVAQSAGTATLTAGIQAGSGLAMSGLTMRGLRISPSTTTRAFGSGNLAAAVNLFNQAVNATIEDCWIDGGGIIPCGIVASGGSSGLTLQRLDVGNCTNIGIRLSDDSVPVGGGTAQVASNTTVISRANDLNVHGIYRRVADTGAWPRGSAGGAGEYGILLGHLVANEVAKVKVRDCGFAGLVFANAAKQITISSLDVDGIHGASPTTGDFFGAGVYYSRYAGNTQANAGGDAIEIYQFALGLESGDLQHGFYMESNHNVANDEAAYYPFIHDGAINAARPTYTREDGVTVTVPIRIGVWIDQGTDHPRVTGVVMTGVTSGILDRSNPASVASSTWPTAVNGLSTLTQSGNTVPSGVTLVIYGDPGTIQPPLTGGAYGPRTGLPTQASSAGITITQNDLTTLVNKSFTGAVVINGAGASRINVAISNCTFNAGLSATNATLSGSDVTIASPAAAFTLSNCGGTLDHGTVTGAGADAVSLTSTCSNISMSNWSVRSAGTAGAYGVRVTSASNVTFRAWDIQGFNGGAVRLSGASPTDVLNVVFDQDAAANKVIIGGTFRLLTSKLSGIRNATFKGAAPSAFDCGATTPDQFLCVSPVCDYNYAETAKSYTFGAATRNMQHVVDLGHDLSLYFPTYTEHIISPIAMTATSPIQVTSGGVEYVTTKPSTTVSTSTHNHGLQTGMVVNVINAGLSGLNGADGQRTITVTSPTTFTLNGTSGTGSYDVTGGYDNHTRIELVSVPTGIQSSIAYIEPGRFPVGVRPTDASASDFPTTGLPSNVTVTVKTTGLIIMKNTSSTSPYVIEDKVFSHDGFVRKGSLVSGTTTLAQMQTPTMQFSGLFVLRRCYFSCVQVDTTTVAGAPTPNLTLEDCWIMNRNLSQASAKAWIKSGVAGAMPFYDGKILCTKMMQVGDGDNFVMNRCFIAYGHDDNFVGGCPNGSMRNNTWLSSDPLGTPAVAGSPHEDRWASSQTLAQNGYFEERNSRIFFGAHTVYWRNVNPPVGYGTLWLGDNDVQNIKFNAPAVPYSGYPDPAGTDTRGGSGEILNMAEPGSGAAGHASVPTPANLAVIFDSNRWDPNTSTPPIDGTTQIFTGPVTTPNPSYWTTTHSGYNAGDTITALKISGPPSMSAMNKAAVGAVIGVTGGAWARKPSSYTYTWSRGATVIRTFTTSAFTDTYTIASGDVGGTITVSVSASDATGSLGTQAAQGAIQATT